MSVSTSVRKNTPSRTQVSSALPSGLLRAAKSAGGKGALADRMETTTKTIDRALTGETLPELHTVLAATLADHTALDEVFALYGFRASLIRADAANDMALVTDLSAAATEFLRRLGDGIRCHNDTGALALLFRHLIPQMQAVVDEHDARVAA